MIKRQNIEKSPPKKFSLQQEERKGGKIKKTITEEIEGEEEESKSDIMRRLQKQKDEEKALLRIGKKIEDIPTVEPQPMPGKKDSKLEGGFSIGLSGNHPELNVFRGKVKTKGKNIQVVLLDLLKSYQ